MTTGHNRIITNGKGERFACLNLERFQTKARSMQPAEIGQMVSKIVEAGQSNDEHALNTYGDVLGTLDDLPVKK